MLGSKLSRRLVAAVALATALFAAVPAWAAEEAWEGPQGFFAGLIGWLVDVSMAGTTGTSREHDGPYIDPNGRTGSCQDPAGCGGSSPAPDSSEGGS